MTAGRVCLAPVAAQSILSGLPRPCQRHGRARHLKDSDEMPALAVRHPACYTPLMDADLVTIKSLVLGAGFDRVGVAPTCAAKAPPAWSRSILMVALAALDEAFDYQIFVAYGSQRRWYKFAYEILVANGYQAAGALASLGLRAQPPIY